MVHIPQKFLICQGDAVGWKVVGPSPRVCIGSLGSPGSPTVQILCANGCLSGRLRLSSGTENV